MKVCVPPAPLLDGRPWKCFQILKEAGHEILLPPEGLKESAEIAREYFAPAHGVLAGAEAFTREVIEACPNLAIIARSGVGYDAVDVTAATEHGVLVTITPGHNQDAVADLALAFILVLVRDIHNLHREIVEGRWPRPVMESPRNSVLGIVGLGRIGRAVVRHARPFGFKLLVAELEPDQDFVQEHGLEVVGFEELLSRSDYVTLHVPLIPETRHLINADTISLMKDGACLINTARGGLVDEVALTEALKSGKLRGAGLDVFEDEPPVGSPLLSAPNVVLAPHVGGLDVASLEGMSSMAAQSIVDVLDGRLPAEGVVNPEAWERRRQ